MSSTKRHKKWTSTATPRFATFDISHFPRSHSYDIQASNLKTVHMRDDND